MHEVTFKEEANILSLATGPAAHPSEIARLTGYKARTLQLLLQEMALSGHVLTGGQKQRLAIARAIYNDPVYVVMDEPNANLDDDGERALVELIKQLKDNGTLLIFSTHRPKLVAAADLALVLHDGGQAAFGTLADVVQGAKQLRGNASAKTAPTAAIAQPSTGGQP